MSFILDALKKSEAERQRQSGPTLLELRITQPRRRYPAWALWVGVLLALNAAVLLYALLRRPPGSEPAVAATSLAPPTGTVSAPAPLPAGQVSAALPAAAPAPALAKAPATTAPAVTASAPAVTTVAPLAPAQAAQRAADPASSNPADDAPAVPASSLRGNAGGDALPAANTDYASLPSLASLGGNLPSLQLNLLDYSTVASERFALINMHRVHDGDVLPEGPRVLAITREGVALDYQGEQFMLRSSGNPAQ
jgi:general secretion pathway protein B